MSPFFSFGHMQVHGCFSLFCLSNLFSYLYSSFGQLLLCLHNFEDEKRINEFPALNSNSVVDKEINSTFSSALASALALRIVLISFNFSLTACIFPLLISLFHGKQYFQLFSFFCEQTHNWVCTIYTRSIASPRWSPLSICKTLVRYAHMLCSDR